MRGDVSDTYNIFNMFPYIEWSLTRCWRLTMTDGLRRKRHMPQKGISLETSTLSKVLCTILSNWGSTHSPPTEVDVCQKAAWRFVAKHFAPNKSQARQCSLRRRRRDIQSLKSKSVSAVWLWSRHLISLDLCFFRPVVGVKNHFC